VRDWWFARPGLIGLLATILPYLSNFALALKPVRFLMSKIMRIEPRHKFPKYSRPNLRTPVNVSTKRPGILLFPGCFIRYNRPELGRTVIKLLELNGFATEVAASECCGVPAIANGDAALARALVRSNVKAMAHQVNSGMRIVTACSSCGHMLKTGFGGLLDEDKAFAEEVKKIAANTFDLAELLVQQLDAGSLNTNFQPSSLKLAYHAPCHQKSQGIGRPWYHLLCQIPGMAIVDLDSGCCGMSGTYGFKQEKYDVSMAIGHDLFESIHAAQPQMVTTECATCQLQIEHGTSAKTIHPAEVMLQAYGEHRCN
jgi:glycerol-3-phosphate dehydrogenase subunit C